MCQHQQCQHHQHHAAACCPNFVRGVSSTSSYVNATPVLLHSLASWRNAPVVSEHLAAVYDIWEAEGALDTNLDICIDAATVVSNAAAAATGAAPSATRKQHLAVVDM